MLAQLRAPSAWLLARPLGARRRMGAEWAVIR